MPSLSDKGRIAHLESQLEKVRGLVPRWREDSLLLGESDDYGAQLDRCADELTAILQPASDEVSSA